MKKFLKALGIVLGSIIGLAVLLLLALTIFQYNPDDIEQLSVMGDSTNSVQLDTKYSALNWNIGYAGLDKDTDFFMDGGEMVLPISEEHVERAQENILSLIEETDAEINFIQEIDEDSKRTYGINQVDLFHNRLGGTSTFAYNYKAPYVPFPLPTTLGKMASGIYLNSSFDVWESYRYQQPSPHKWPVSTANLKRGFNASYMPIENSDKYLVAINVHLDAYESGNTGKIAQTKQVLEFANTEYEKGNYVLIGGDWNQDLSDEGPMPAPEGIWRPEPFDLSLLPQGFTLLKDDSTTTTVVNNQPYDPNDSYEYVIDGYIASENIEILDVTTMDEGYVDSDHNPVLLEFKLK